MTTMHPFHHQRQPAPKGAFGTRLRRYLAVLLLVAAGSFALAPMADARLGGGGSFGSRGSRTYSMPSATPTAPRVAPVQRSTTPNYSNPGYGYNRSPGFFGGGFGRGLLGGFLGAGLFGLLFGHGMFGGIGGGMSLIGLLLQIGLLYLAFRFIMGFFNRQPMSALGGAPGGGFQNGWQQPPQNGGGFGGGPAARPRPIDIRPEDYQTFEYRLAESQSAYSDGDVGRLRRIATPEMAGNFEAELTENDRRGVVNKIGDVRLLQGDLSEAWQEGGTDYATVAMRFSLIDATLDKVSGRVVAGDATRPQEVTEVWTFRRPAGSAPQNWLLSAIQQA